MGIKPTPLDPHGRGPLPGGQVDGVRDAVSERAQTTTVGYDPDHPYDDQSRSLNDLRWAVRAVTGLSNADQH